MATVRIASAIVLVAMTAACGRPDDVGAAGDGVASDVAPAAVAQRMDDYVAAALADRLAAFPDFWTEDAQVFKPALERNGPTAMPAMVTDALTSMKLTAMAVHTTDIAVHDGGAVAHQLASADQTLAPRDGKGAPVHERLNFLVRWRKEADGVWRIDRFIETPMPTEPVGTAPH